MDNFWQKFWRFYNSWTGSIIFVLVVVLFIAQAFTIPSGSMKNTLLIGDHLVVKKFSYGIPRPWLPFAEIPLLPDFNGNGHLISANGPKRGDIVVFRNVDNEKIHFIKRCVAVGKDRVIYAKKTLFVNMHEGYEYMKEHYPNRKMLQIDGLWYVIEPYTKPGIHYDERVDFDRIIQNYKAAGKFAMKANYFKELDDYFGSDNYQAYEFDVPKDNYFMMGDNRDHSNDSRFWGSVPYKNIEGKPWFIYLSWDQDYHIRWDRMFKTINSIEDNDELIEETKQDVEALD